MKALLFGGRSKPSPPPSGPSAPTKAQAHPQSSASASPDAKPAAVEREASEGEMVVQERSGPRHLHGFFSQVGASMDAQVQISTKDLVLVAAHFITAALQSALVPPPSSPSKFDERNFVPRVASVSPDFDHVNQFFSACVRRAEFSLETIVGSLILFKRFSQLTPVSVYSWRIILLVAILLAQKVVDDDSLGTDQFSELWTCATKPSGVTFELPPKTAGRLETEMLVLSGFEVNIKAKEWFTSHMELRELWIREFHSSNFHLELPHSDVSKRFVRRTDSKERATLG